MSDNKQKTDIELLEEISNNDTTAINELIVRYRGTVETIAQKYVGSPLEKDDLVQEGMIGLLAAINLTTAKKALNLLHTHLGA